jgi:hypothetical protein
LVWISLFPIKTFAQRKETDSLLNQLQSEKIDTNRVNLYKWAAKAMYIYNPDSAMGLAEQGLKLSKKIKYKAGEANCMNEIANILTRQGNYPLALHYHLQKLKLNEDLHDITGLATTNMNIGIVYVYQEDYTNALINYRKANAIIQANHITQQEYNIALNIGDVFDKTNQLDSAENYYSLSLRIAKEKQDEDLIGTSFLGLGNIARKKKNLDEAISNYTIANTYLSRANDEDLICESSLGLAKIKEQVQQKDSAIYYAHQSLYFALKDKFISRQYDAASFLNALYEKLPNIDSAYYYLKLSNSLHDTLVGKDKMMAVNTLTFNEQVRQKELAEKMMQEKEERANQLQLIFIGMFIPIIFFFAILLAKAKISLKFIRFLGVISLLFLFEYLTLLLHPVVVELTHHTPIFEIIIFVMLAGVLIPFHHRLEHAVLDYLVRRSQKNKLTLQKPSILHAIYATHNSNSSQQSIEEHPMDKEDKNYFSSSSKKRNKHKKK